MKNTVLMVGVALVVSLLMFMVFGSGQKETAAQKESVYDRVLASGTIRCGYATWPPYMMKDPNTGTLSGINYDVMELIGKELNLKIDWVEEVPWGSVYANLNANRMDVMCATIWDDGERVKQFTLSDPQFYSALYAYVRAA